MHKFVPHYQHHKRVPNFSFPCVVDNCERTFMNYSSDQSHIYRDHLRNRQTHARSIVVVTSFCKVTQCNFKCRHLKDLQYFETHLRVSRNDIYEDICDGSSFTCNQFYIDNPSALRIILYQDAFEVVNPLGSGRKKHKVIAIYLTLADLKPSCRFNIDLMQLVMLVKEQNFKQFGQEAVSHPLLQDLMTLEEVGVQLNLTGTNEMVKGTIVIIAGDNFGSHCIGGYTENFSKNNYFCRYCRIDRQSFLQNACCIGPARTRESYDNVVKHIDNDHPTYGIKFPSLFNKLKHFHVAQPGLLLIMERSLEDMLFKIGVCSKCYHSY